MTVREKYQLIDTTINQIVEEKIWLSANKLRDQEAKITEQNWEIQRLLKIEKERKRNDDTIKNINNINNKLIALLDKISETNEDLKKIEDWDSWYDEYGNWWGRQTRWYVYKWEYAEIEYCSF